MKSSKTADFRHFQLDDGDPYGGTTAGIWPISEWLLPAARVERGQLELVALY